MDQQADITIIFDGRCLLCNRFIQIPMKHGGDNFLFVSSYSEKGRELCESQGLPYKGDTETIYVVSRSNVGVLCKSSAIIKILMNCSWQHRIIARTMQLIPVRIRDFVYTQISKNRSTSSTSSCKVPIHLDRSKVYL